MTIRLLLTLVVLIFGGYPPAASAGDIYYLIDEEGRIVFTNAPADPRFRPYSQEGPGPGLEKHIIRLARRYNVDPGLIWAVIQVESNWSRWAVSPKGAMGLMQIMPTTAQNLSLKNPFDPYENIEAGVRYLRKLYDEFGRWDLALAAYNAGPERVRRQRGVPPIRETRLYVKKVLRLWQQNSYLFP